MKILNVVLIGMGLFDLATFYAMFNLFIIATLFALFKIENRNRNKKIDFPLNT